MNWGENQALWQMVWEAACMQGFQVSLGSLGKQPCSAASTDPCHLQQAHTELKPSSCNRDLSVTTHLSTHKLLLPLTYTYFTLLVSHFYGKFRDTSFSLSFLFPFPLFHGWMKPQKANKTNSLLQTSAKMRQLFDCIWSTQCKSQPKRHKPKPHGL